MFFNIEDRVYGRKWHFTAVSYDRSNFYNIDYRWFVTDEAEL